MLHRQSPNKAINSDNSETLTSQIQNPTVRNFGIPESYTLNPWLSLKEKKQNPKNPECNVTYKTLCVRNATRKPGLTIYSVCQCMNWCEPVGSCETLSAVILRSSPGNALLTRILAYDSCNPWFFVFFAQK